MIFDMPVDRFFYDGPLEQSASISLEGPEHHHIKVMRIGIGEEIELVNGQGVLAKATLSRIDRHIAFLKIHQLHRADRPTPRIALGIPLLRPNKLELIFEKGTELGADSFLLYPAERSEKIHLSDNALIRLRAITSSALKQSGRLYSPTIEVLAHFKELFQRDAMPLFGDTNPEAPWISPAKENTLFISGPESGFSPNEEQLLAHAKGIKLSKNILRAETAPIAALTVLILSC
ncbi:MAG: 16S rRNA (uracil(1498)-N(3))-methyltransferase [Verrucomicrobiota bacterium]|nr:16S rRNA (uracil(1498)-N(3))-methyltransferase [Verrucomicrobiota bacterium]